MSRFIKHKNRGGFISLIVSVLIFSCIVLGFITGMGSLTKKATQEQKASLETAIARSTIECYAFEGAYPNSLKYMEDNYSLSFDKDKFFVDYRPMGENIFPEITVIIKEDKQ